MKIFNLKSLATAALLTVVSGTSALAAVLISGEEVDGDVVFNLSGSYDVSAASFFTSGSVSTTVSAARGVINFGPSVSNSYDFYVIDIFPALGFGTGVSTNGVGVGDLFALTRSGDTRLVGVAPGTTTGSVFGTLTFAGNSFAGLGLTEGIYDYAWAGDSAQLQIGVSPVPLPAGGLLLLTGIGGVAALKRRKKRAA